MLRTWNLRGHRIVPLLLVGLATLAACAPRPVRKAAPLDLSLPSGKVEGTRFTGIRVPLTLDAGDTGWTVSTDYPEFLLEQGYGKGGLESGLVFVFNPKSRSSLQVSFAAAGAYSTFDQETMEWLTNAVGGGVEAEVKEGHKGHGSGVVMGKAQPVRLQGVPYAAKSFAIYEVGGVKRENGWIYAFAEPYQIFILYQLVDPHANADRQALEKILASFRYSGPQVGP